MSEQNIEAVRRSIAYWNDGDLEGFLSRLDPDVEWRTSGLYPDVDPVYHGRDGVRKFWHDFHEIWASLEMDIRELVASGDRVAFGFHFDARGRDGMSVGRDQASLATMRDGLLVRIHNYPSWEEALEALRAGESTDEVGETVSRAGEEGS